MKTFKTAVAGILLFGIAALFTPTARAAVTGTVSRWVGNALIFDGSSGDNAWAFDVNGLRADFGTGANDYASSDGTTVTFAGTIAVGTNAGTPGSGTGFTTNNTGQVVHAVHKITIGEAALDAAGTSDETIWTVPAKTRVLRMVADVTATFSGGAITDMDVVCGPSAGSNGYLISFDVDTAIGTYGEVAAEIGANLLSATYADIPSWSTTTAIICRFTCGGGNCDTATQGSMTLYIEHLVYP